MEPPDEAAHRPAAGMPPRTATGRRRRWLLAVGVGCVHVDPARPARSRVAGPPILDPTHGTDPIDRQTHRPPILSRRRCGVALAAYGARRAYLAGIAAGRASATPSPHPRRRKGEKAPSDDDDDDDEEGDDDPSARPTPGPAHSTANGDVPPTPIGKKGALQQAAAAAAASTTPPCTPRGGPERASTPGEWRDRLTSRPRSNSTAAAADDDGASAVDLVATYDRIQREFTEANGAFDPAAVADAARWFHFEPPPGVGVWPVEYTKLGLPAGCTRLVVLMLEDAPAVAAAGAACAREVMRAMRGVGCFNVSRGAYHVTVFFLSLPTDPVEDPTGGENGKKSRGGAVGFHPDHDAEEAAVHDALRGAVDVAPDGDASNRNGSRDNGVNGAGSKSHREDAVGEVTLEVDRVAMAKSGALLLLFRDPDGTLDRARRALRGAFPGAPSKQTAIAHCTLLRAFPRASGDTPIGEDASSSFGGALSGRALADVSASCARWTHRLAGARVKVSRAWLVREERFSSVDGPRSSFHL